MNSIKSYQKLLYYSNVIENPKELIELLEESENNDSSYISKWYWADIIDNIEIFKIPAHEFTEIKDIDINANYKNLNSTKINKILNESIKNIRDNCFEKDYVLRYISICKNRMGKTLGIHVDSDLDTDSISAIFYLNNDYEDGQIVFPKLDLELKPSPGSVLIFPSDENYSHFSKVITGGIKYTINSFWI